jgi:hypothetical protein
MFKSLGDPMWGVTERDILMTASKLSIKKFLWRRKGE